MSEPLLVVDEPAPHASPETVFECARERMRLRGISSFSCYSNTGTLNDRVASTLLDAARVKTNRSPLLRGARQGLATCPSPQPRNTTVPQYHAAF